ncbi:MAG: hypothetical protein ONB46_15100 [candidate division KSB1 bacterium]|nr:hypothetical protein [candidate division KSB1 bacterium]MDZ7366984.1 hypothetical protein [candidate division KSB1 bacterium]MDZ7406811.1 hypothetical protein [candidate division KSB1 bacterium]
MVEGTFAYQEAHLKVFIKNYGKFKSLQSRNATLLVQALKRVAWLDILLNGRFDAIPKVCAI